MFMGIKAGRENVRPEMQTMKMTAKIMGHKNTDNYFDETFKVLSTDKSNRSTRRRSINFRSFVRFDVL